MCFLSATYSSLYTQCFIICLLLLNSMLWHRQAIFESKEDKLSSAAECRIRTQGLRHLFASRLNACWQTDWAIEDQAKNLNSTARPYIWLNMLPSDSFMSCLDSRLGYSTGGCKLCNWLFCCLVPWINHSPPVNWSTFGNRVWDDSGFVSLTLWRTSFSLLKLCFIIILMPHNMIILYLHYSSRTGGWGAGGNKRNRGICYPYIRH